MLYCEVEKKNDTVCFLDIFISYKSYFKIFMVDVNKGHKFFSQNFTVEISTPVEYSTKNRFLHLWEKAQKWHLTSKNAIFQRMWGLHVQYL